MKQTEAFSPALEPEAGFIPQQPGAAEIAIGDADPPAADEPEDAADIVGTSAPEHRWPGTGLVWVLAAGGIFSFWQVARLLIMDLGDPPLSEILLTLPMMVFPGALALWMARKIQTFRLVALGPAMLFLLWSLYACVMRLLRADHVAEIGFGFLGVALAILWIGYLWTRRSDFS